MKKTLLIIVCLIVSVSAWAYDYDYAGCYKTVKLTYSSFDENNEPITLSEMVTVPLLKDKSTNREIGFFVLCSLPYTTDPTKCASGEQPLDALVLRTIATEGAMVVQVDGQGLGESESHVRPLLANKVNGRQMIDGLLAAMDYAKEQGISVNQNYYTINAGYSLAGGVAVAVQRYLEKYSSKDDKARVRLRKTICGGAPVSCTATAELALENARKNKGTDWRVPILKGCTEAYKNSTLRTVDLGEIFVNDSTVNLDNFDSDSPAARAVKKVMLQEDMQNDWIPETPITMIFHADDDWVPYTNAQLALEAWGKDKLRLIDKDMTSMKWNVSLLRPVREYVNKYAGLNPHFQGVVDFYTGMIDGCLRDTLIASSYGRAVNYKDVLNTAFDIASGLNISIPVDISTSIQGMTINIQSLGNMQCSGTLLKDNGSSMGTFNITMKPEIQDQDNTKITQVDASGYLHMPIDFTVVLPDVVLKFDLTLTGSVNDAYQFVEQLNAILLHRTCKNKSDAQKYCDAINSNFTCTAHMVWVFDGTVYFNFTSGSDGYTIEPYINYRKFYINYDEPLATCLSYNAKLDITPYLTIDNQKLEVGDYTAMFHVTERGDGYVNLYADVLTADSTVMARADMYITPVNMNSDGTEATLNIEFTVNVPDYHVQVAGRCSNLNDAAIAALLCFSNLSCKTEDEARNYASVLNSDIQAELYVENVNSEGKYDGKQDYTDYGGVHAAVFQDAAGAYYVEYCLNWMGQKDIPLKTVIHTITQ